MAKTDWHHDNVNPDDFASREVVEAALALALTPPWPPHFRPTWSDLHELTGPTRLDELTDRKTVCDTTLEVLRYTPCVKTLDLMSTRVTDAGMRAMRYVPQLESLWLINTRITDEGIKYLLDHKHLKEVVALHSGVTITGERLLNQSIRGCRASIGREGASGVVTAVDGPSFTVKLTWREETVTAVVAEKQRSRLQDFLKAPVGRHVVLVIGEAGEQNRIIRARRITS